MSIKYNIGGSATFNGVIMINLYKGKAARATRNSDGEVLIEELPAFCKAMKLYKNNIERRVSKIPVIRELCRTLLMFVTVISSLLTGVAGIFSFRKKWSIKRFISILLLGISIYVLLFSENYYSIGLLVIPIIYFKREIATMLKYHGAEHKCINMYESVGDISNIDVEYIHTFSRIHLRCGTNIVFLLVPLSIIYYIAIEQYLIYMAAGSLIDLIVSVIILGISIEIFKISQKPAMRWILKPGVLLQKYLTTKEPDNSQLEVALRALRAVIED